MPAVRLHREDVKAQLRKRHRTLGSFAEARGLKAQQVADWLRGRVSAPVAQAIADELGVEAVHLEGESMELDGSARSASSHRQSAGGR